MSDEEITQTACEGVKMYSYEVSLKRNRPVFCFSCTRNNLVVFVGRRREEIC